MLDRISKDFADYFYRSERVRQSFELANPYESVLAANASKSIQTITETKVNAGLNWMAAKRAVLLLTDKRLVCGDLSLPLESINSATLVKIIGLFGAGQVLKISTNKGAHYQFGMQVNPEWKTQQALPFSFESAYTWPYPIIYGARLFIVAYLLYCAYWYFIHDWLN